MGIRLNGYEFGGRVTAAAETLRETGGRDARVIVLRGIVEGPAPAAAIEAELDAIAAAAAPLPGFAALSLRAGRELLVTRTGFRRERHRGGGAAAFELTLEARDPFERADEESVAHVWFAFPGATAPAPAGGNAAAPLHARLTPDEAVTRPSLSDGERTLVYDGVVEGGGSLILDGEARRAYLEGEDVTPHTSGVFPRLAPGANTLIYSHESEVGAQVAAELRFRARWV